MCASGILLALTILLAWVLWRLFLVTIRVFFYVVLAGVLAFVLALFTLVIMMVWAASSGAL